MIWSLLPQQFFEDTISPIKSPQYNSEFSIYYYTVLKSSAYSEFSIAAFRLLQVRETLPWLSALREKGTCLLRDPLPSTLWQHVLCLQQHHHNGQLVKQLEVYLQHVTNHKLFDIMCYNKVLLVMRKELDLRRGRVCCMYYALLSY